MIPTEIAERVLRMVQDGAVVSVTGKVIKLRTDTVCIHGDTAGAVEIARGVRAAADAGIAVAPFARADQTSPRIARAKRGNPESDSALWIARCARNDGWKSACLAQNGCVDSVPNTMPAITDSAA